MREDTVQLVVVGSIGLDDIATPAGRRTNVLGGSATYACAAAAFFTRPGLVGAAGCDFPRRHWTFYRRLGVDLTGLQVLELPTFRWAGEYAEDMNQRQTLRTELNALGAFRPSLPAPYRKAPFLFLGNLQPAIQHEVLDQMRAPRFVAVDTMDLWIRTARREVEAIWARADLVTLNDAEARLYSGETDLVRALRRILRCGPRYVVIKKGEHGALWASRRGIGLLPAFPVERTVDPTGAGDAFAGGLMGALAKLGRTDEPAIRYGLEQGAVAASFCVEAFGPARLGRLTPGELARRWRQFCRMGQPSSERSWR